MLVQFAELPVFDQARAKRFYIDHLHCQIVADVSVNRDSWHWLELKFSVAETALHVLRRPDETPSKDPVLVFVAEDVEATVQELAANGVTFHYEAWPPKSGHDDPGQLMQSHRHQQAVNEPRVIACLVPRAGVSRSGRVL